eukprot:g51544.t1
MNDKSSIVIVEHNTAPARNVARPLPPPPPLEQVARAEDTPMVPRNRNRTSTRSSARRIQFVDSKHLPLPKPKAPRDIDGDVDARNIMVGKRGRRQTPEGTATHSYRLAIAEDDEAQFAPQTDSSDGLRYEDVCLFIRVLRKPEKQLRVIPQDAEEDKVKLTRTGFVDAIKEDEATGEKKYKSRLVIYGNQMIPYQHFSPYDTSSPVADRNDFSQAYSHASMQEICCAIPPDDCKMQDKPSMICRVKKALYGSPQAGRRWAVMKPFPQ